MAFHVPSADMGHLMAGMLALVVASQVLGGLFARWHQPRVLGEIGGGILLGSSVLGAYAPGLFDTLFNSTKIHGPVMGFAFQLGLMLFMFGAGLESKDYGKLSEARTVVWTTLLGFAVPLLVGLAAASWSGWAPFLGPASTPTSFAVFFGLCIAVTAIPVISKILMDLDLLQSPFGRAVLTVAFAEDVVLWLTLAVLLGYGSSASRTPLEHALSVLATLGAFVAVVGWGHRLYDWLARSPLNLLKGCPAVVGPVVTLFAAVVLLEPLAVRPIFGAFLAGYVIANAKTVAEETRHHLQGLAAGLFVPLFFAGVGFNLDLHAGVNLGLLALVVLLSMGVKVVAVFLGGRFAGERASTSLHLAVALNARGAVGIVLATIGLEAHLITPAFHIVLVIMALVSTQVAGMWLYAVKRSRPQELILAGASPVLVARTEAHV